MKESDMNPIAFLGQVLFQIKRIGNHALREYKTDLIQRNDRKKKIKFISERTDLLNPGNIFFGENSSINGGFLSAIGGKIVVGDNCLLSYGIHMRTDMHVHQNKDALILEQGHKYADIVIGNDVWVGYGVQIMSGVTVSDGCVIGAGAIVTKDTEPYGVYAGVPARLVARRCSMHPETDG